MQSRKVVIHSALSSFSAIATRRIILVDNPEAADILLSITAWTDESATLGDGKAMQNNPDWARVVIVDETDAFDSTSHV